MSTEISSMKKYRYVPNIGFVKKSRLFLLGLFIFASIIFQFIPTSQAEPELQIYEIELKTTEINQKSLEEKIANYAMKNNRKMKFPVALKLARAIIKESETLEVPHHIIIGIIKVESGFNQFAIGQAGEVGLMQIMPDIHNDKIKHLKKINRLKTVDLYDVKFNTKLGGLVLGECFKKYEGDVQMSLKCYNGSVKDRKNIYPNKVFRAAAISEEYI